MDLNPITENNECKTVLLSDEPTTEDAFGGHSRIARAIYDLIKNEDGGKSIALTGCWGSGKSTVIKLFEKEVQNKNDEKIKIFTFNSWIHQGDPLRLSFLETFVKYLGNQNWLDINKWLKKLKDIKQQSEESLTVTESIIKKITFSTFVIPIGIAVFSKFENYIGILGLILSFMPGIYIVETFFRF